MDFSALEGFHFLRPWWLLAMAPAMMLGWCLRNPASHAGDWVKVCDPELLEAMLEPRTRACRRGPLAMIAVGWLIAVIALAGPTWERSDSALLERQLARVVVLDLSRSMHAGDVTPSRLERAKLKIAEILERSDEGEVGLVAYAGEAFVVSPLTTDAATVRAQLGALAPEIMPVQGSAPRDGLERAGELLRRAGYRTGTVVLIADSAGPQAQAAAKRLREKGYRVNVLGMGTSQGAPIPRAEGGFVTDPGGRIVTPALDESALRTTATAGGGRYLRQRPDMGDVDRLLAGTEAAGVSNAPADTGDRYRGTWRDSGPWLVLALLPLAALAFRRGWLLAAVVAVGVSAPPAQAAEWSALWQRPDQRAQRALEAGDFARAAELARTPLRKGTALYRAGRYAAAAEQFARADGAVADYNRGNALARAGRLRAALHAYDRALAARPAMADARANRETVAETLRRRERESRSTRRASNESSRDGKRRQDGGRGQAQRGGPEGERRARAGERRRTADASRGRRPSAKGERQAERQGQRGGDSGAGAPGQAQADHRVPRRAPQTGPEANGRRSPSGTGVPSRDRERRQAAEQWLRRVPDDPGGFLRRKFLREYRRRDAAGDAGEGRW